MNRKFLRVVVPVLVIVEFCLGFLMYKSYNNFTSINEDNLVNEINNKQFSMFVENSNGKYVEYTGSNYFPSGYVLNTDKTLCTDNRGVKVENVLLVNDNNITVSSDKTIFCYLYFDLA